LVADQDWLGYVPGVRRLWESSEQKGMDDQILFDVPQGTEERPRCMMTFNRGELLSMVQYVQSGSNAPKFDTLDDRKR